jgi:hypothetical protein
MCKAGRHKNSFVEGQGQTEKGRRLEEYNKEQISKSSTKYDK